jgi:glucokinase-like ROK family protein
MRTKLDPGTMREVNRALLLDVLRSAGRLSRSDVARRTALAKPTVSAIVEQLIDEGVVREVGFGTAMANGGRRPRLLEYDAASEAFLGIQVGVNTTTVALADGRGELRESRTGRTAKRSPTRTVAAIADLVDDVLAAGRVRRRRIAAAAAVVPGLVERESGFCRVAPNLGWHDVPLRELLAEALRVPITVENTTRAAAIAESRVGVARDARSFVWVYAGTGIGSSSVIDGELFYGHQGFSGEIGHCCVVDDGLVCGCGRRGCLETVASATAVARNAQSAIDRGERTLLLAGRRGIDAAGVAAAAAEGDALSVRVIADAGDHLGKGISFLLNLTNPELVVIGGPLARAGDFLLTPLRASAERHALQEVQASIVASQLDGDAEVRGSVFLAMIHAASAVPASAAV